MEKLTADRLTLDELKALLGSKMVLETRASESFIRNFGKAMGSYQPESEVVRFLKDEIAKIMGQVVAERIVFEDSSAIEYEDFNQFEQALIAKVYGHFDAAEVEKAFQPEGIEGFIRPVFSAMVFSMNQGQHDAYRDYKVWLNKFLELAFYLGKTPLELPIDQKTSDMIIRRGMTVSIYHQLRLREIDEMANLQNFLNMIVLPGLIAEMEQMGIPDEELQLRIDERLQQIMPDIVNRLTLARRLLLDDLNEDVKRIFMSFD